MRFYFAMQSFCLTNLAYSEKKHVYSYHVQNIFVYLCFENKMVAWSVSNKTSGPMNLVEHFSYCSIFSYRSYFLIAKLYLTKHSVLDVLVIRNVHYDTISKRVFPEKFALKIQKLGFLCFLFQYLSL